MAEFKPGTSGVRIDCSANCATTTALSIVACVSPPI